MVVVGDIDNSFAPQDISNPVRRAQNIETMINIDPVSNLQVFERFRVNKIFDERYDFLGTIH